MKIRTLICVGLFASLSGCVSILPDPEPAPSVYRLTNAVNPAVEKALNAETIRVDRPTASQIYNSNDIVVSMDGRKLSTVAQAKWSEVMPVIIQETLVDALAGTEQYIGLIPTSGARTETRLHLAVKNFEANFDNGPEEVPLAIVQYRVTYADASNRKLLGTYSVRKTQRATSKNVSSIVTAIEAANHDAILDIVDWLEQKKLGGA